MPKDRFARDIIAKAGAMANKPQFFASRRIVGISRLAAGLISCFLPLCSIIAGWHKIFDCRLACPLEAPDRFVGSFRDPAGLAGFLFQCCNELIVHPVVREKQQVTIDNRAGGSTNPMVAIQVTAFPEFFAGLRVQTGCAVGAEVHVDSPLNDRGRVACVLGDCIRSAAWPRRRP